MNPQQDSAKASTAENDLRRAIAALRSGHAVEAERLAAHILEGGDAAGLATKILAQALLAQGRPADAIAPLELALRRGIDPELHILLGRALGAVGREAEALAALTAAAAYRPLIPQAFLSLGDYLGKLGRTGEAVAMLEEGLSLSDGDPLLAIGLGYLHLRRQDPARAMIYFAKAHAALPDQYDALVGTALAKALGGDFTRAQELYERALKMRPGDLTTRVNLGKCLLELGEKAAGEDALREAGAAGARIGRLVTALADTAHGRLFVRPSAARAFLDGEPP